MTAPDRSIHALLSLYLPSILLSFCGSLIVPIMPLLALDMVDTYAMVGVALAAPGIGTLVSDIPTGMAIRRFGHKKTMLLGACLMLFSAAGMLQVQGITELFLLRLITGVGLALWTISRHTYMIPLFSSERRGRGSAMVGGIHRLTSFTGPFIGGLIGESYGLRAPFVIYSILTLTALIMVILWVPSGQRSVSDSRTQQPARLADVLRARYGILLRTGPAFFCVSVIRSARDVIIPLYAAETLGLTASWIGVVTGISYGADLMMVYPAGVIMDRFGRKYASVPCFLIQAAAMALLPLADSFAILLSVAIVLGLGNGLGAGTMIALGADTAPKEGAGMFLGVWRFIGDSGGATAPLAVGEVADLAGFDSAALAVAAVGLGAALLLWRMVPETLVKSSNMA